MNAFLEENRAFWAREAARIPRFSGRYVLVDFMADHACYLMINALIGKALEARHGHRLIAVTLAGPKSERMRALAQSYGIEMAYRCPDSIGSEEVSAAAALLQAIKSMENTAAIREAVLNLQADGVKVGDLVYDSFLREQGLPSLVGDPRALALIAAAGLQQHRFYRSLTQRYDVAACVLGHIVYRQYGLLARNVAARGGETYSRSGSVPNLLLRRYRRLADLDDHERCMPPAEIDRLASDLGGDALEQRGRAALEARFAGREPQLESVSDAFFSDKRTYKRSELCDALGLDPRKPIVFVMIQVYSDGPHSFRGMLFPDYAHYLVDTCVQAAAIPDVNWIIRDHPSNERYNPGWSAARMVADVLAAHRHIALCPPDLSPRNMHELADAAVAIGDIALELAGAGVPCIVPAHGIAWGHGFSFDPATREEYFALLRRAGSLPRLRESQVRRAHQVAYTLLCTRFEDGIVPPHSRVWFREGAQDELYERAAERLRTRTLEADPLWCGFQRMLDRDRDYLFPCDPEPRA